MRHEIIILTIAAILSYFAEALYAPFYAVYVEKIGGGVVDAGFAWGIYMTVLGLMVFIVARYVDRLKRHAWILYTGFLSASVLSFAYIFVSNVWQLFLIQFLMGLTWAAVNPVWDAYYSLFITKRHAATDWSLFEGGSRLANGIAAITGGFIIKILGFKAIFALAGLLNLLAAIFLFLERRSFSVVY